MLTQRDEALRFSYDKRSLLHFLQRRFMAALGRGKPLLAYLKVTRRCNLECSYCPWHTHATDTEGELTTAEWMAIVDGFLFTFLYPYAKAASAALPHEEIAAVKQRLLALKKRHRILNTRKQLASKSGWTCYDALTLSVDYRGTVRDGCFVDHVEERNCAECELGCYQLISSFHEFNFEAWFNLHRLLLARV